MTPDRDLPPGYQFGDAAGEGQRRPVARPRLPRPFLVNANANLFQPAPHRHYWIYDPLTDGSKCPCGAVGPSPADVAEGGHR